MIAFTWHRDEKGYDLLPETPARIVGKGGSRKLYRPLDEYPTCSELSRALRKRRKGHSNLSKHFQGLLSLDGAAGGKGKRYQMSLSGQG